MPNVGKSTLFNALTKNNVPAENYPFCTIDPNVGVVAVPDPRLKILADIVKTMKIVPAVIEYYDIAGLVKGAHKGEGLGNEFLGHIRSTDAIVHVGRAFESKDITHVSGVIDPASDRQTIETELILKDLDTISKKIKSLEADARYDDEKKKLLEQALLVSKALNEGKLALTVPSPEDEDVKSWRKQLGLLSDKPVIFVVNVDWETPKPEQVEELRQKMRIDKRFPLLPINIKLEADLAALPDAERDEFKKELGLEFSGLELLAKSCYELLNLISFFTAGEMEARAWTIEKGTTAKKAAGVIHTDFETKFIAADVVAYNDFVECNGWLGAKERGKARLEGKDYIVKDGDVFLFRHGA